MFAAIPHEPPVEKQMTALNLQATGHASRSAMLAAKVCRVLYTADVGPAPLADRPILRRGADLLGDVIRGSLLIGGRPAQGGLTASGAGLRVFGRALVALRLLDSANTSSDVTEVFSRYRAELNALADGEHVPPDDVQRLRAFFRELALLFQQDVERAAFARPTDPIATALAL